MARIRDDIVIDPTGELTVAPRKGAPVCLLKISGKHDLAAARSMGIQLHWTVVYLPGKPQGKMKKINAVIRSCLDRFPFLGQLGLRTPGNIQCFWSVRGTEPVLRIQMKRINQRAYEIVQKEKGGRKPPKIDRHQIEAERFA